MERISGDVIALNGVQETFLASLRDEQSHCRICNWSTPAEYIEVRVFLPTLDSLELASVWLQEWDTSLSE